VQINANNDTVLFMMTIIFYDSGMDSDNCEEWAGVVSTASTKEK
jgi:hypothetical protein